MLKFRWETEFKETEIGEMPKDWEVRKIGIVAKVNEELINKNYNYKIIEYIDINSVESGLILEKKVIPLEIAPTRAKRVVRNNDILLSTVRPNLRHYAFVKYSKPNTIASTGFAVIRAKNIEPRYLYYYITTDFVTEYLTQIAETHTSAYPSFTPDVVENLKTPYPSPPEQSRIATVLSWFDDLIENKKRQNEILEKVAMAIFKSWFVDFEPFKDEEFVYNEELGKEIPKGWEVKSISEIAKIYLGGTPSRNRKEFWNGDIKWATAKDVANTRGVYIFETEEKITKKGLEKSNAKLLPTNTVIITARGTVGEIRLLGEPIAFNQTCYGLVPKDISCYYLFLALRDAITQIKAVSYGTVFDTITMKNFDEIQILLPPQPILEKFHSLVEPLFQKIILNQKQIMVLRKIRDALLPKLVFGKLRVEEI
ncbi:MAG: Restriction endonuclease S subunit [Candidatus Alkanophagales archaeon MCA70_species_2]|nr:Restriction endonuclease S subunit [Candidatus Alkanophaga liquidiphilum]